MTRCKCATCYSPLWDLMQLSMVLAEHRVDCEKCWNNPDYRAGDGCRKYWLMFNAEESLWAEVTRGCPRPKTFTPLHEYVDMVVEERLAKEKGL